MIIEKHAGNVRMYHRAHRPVCEESRVVIAVEIRTNLFHGRGIMARY